MIRGKAWKYGDDVDTDAMMPGKYLALRDMKEVATHCFESVDPSFAKEVRPGDVVVAGRNFGYGSSRPAAEVLRVLGISCVIAESFNKLFFRNAINFGLPVMDCPEAARDIQRGDEVEVDFETGAIHNLTSGKEYQAHPLPAFLHEIAAMGGIVQWARAELRRRAAGESRPEGA